MDAAPVLAPELACQIVRWRREFHRRPEVGWTEFWTTARLAELLGAMGLSPRLGAEMLDKDSRMGLPPEAALSQAMAEAVRPLGDLPGARPDLLSRMDGATGLCVDLAPDKAPGVVLRCDIDALPVRESQASSHRPAREGFRSLREGAMHACGHDGHMAMALGAVRLVLDQLSQGRARLSRNVRLLFQPAEEGVRGAMPLVPLVSGWPYFLAGHIGLACPETGSFAAGVTGAFATAKFNVAFRGREAHAAQAPEEGADALKGACEAVLALHALPRHSRGEGRVCVGRLEGGSGRNVVPGFARFEAEVRGRPQEVCDFLFARAKAAVEGIALANGLDASVELAGQAGSAESDGELSARLARIAEGLSWDGRPVFGRVLEQARVSVSEDACTLMREVQQGGGHASYMLFGSDLAAGHHAPDFDFDEAVLAKGALMLASAVLDLAGSRDSRL